VKKENFLVSVVIPVFNEESTVGDIITRTRNTLEKMKQPYEVLVIDDGSADKSLKISKDKGAVVFKETHQGKGRAIRYGFRRAKGNIIVTLDSDGSHRPEEIPLVLESIIKGKADLSIGSRFINNQANHAKISRMNRAGNKIFNGLIRFLTDSRISDSQSGFKAIRTSFLERMKLSSKGYEVESELLIKALKLGARVTEIPISFEQRTVGKSRLDPYKDGARILYSVITSYLF
jgi:glycosyltransferase involved in cell wall biosynthesis